MTVPDVDDMPDEESYTTYPVRALYSYVVMQMSAIGGIFNCLLSD